MRILLTSLAASVAFLTTAFAETVSIKGTAGSVISASSVAEFDSPWAMTFLPDATLLVTTKPGKLFHVRQDGQKFAVSGVPKVAFGGQGGLGDIVVDPAFDSNSTVFFSYAEQENGLYGAVVSKARLELDAEGGGTLSDIQRIWEQQPKTSGRGHYGHRIAFGPKNTPHEGKLFITSGDRQKQDPAQEMDMGLGKIIRLNLDGSIPDDNPWADGSQGELARTFWSTGHRNPLGISFAADGKLWATEMGPRHGDEINLIERGQNYGWPLVSEGKHYSGVSIPSHNTRPDFKAPKAWWVPGIAPSGLVIYSGNTFPEWQGNAFIGGLVSRALVRVNIAGGAASEAERFPMNARIREVEQGPDGALWVLQDQGGAQLLKIEKP